MKRLSIITINLNNKEGLISTINSVIGQKCKDFEFIVIDGMSDDGSIDIINLNKKFIDKIIIESDSGIYNAMNKGIGLSEGTYLLFLNSGDTLVDNYCIDKSLKFLDGTDIISGDMQMFENGELRIHKAPSFINFKFFLNDSLPHPSTFIKKILFDKYGGYEERYRIVSDWLFFLVVTCKENSTYKKIDCLISNFDTNGISSNVSFRNINFQERELALSQHFGRFIGDFYSYNFEKTKFFFPAINKLIRFLYKKLNEH